MIEVHDKIAIDMVAYMEEKDPDALVSIVNDVLTKELAQFLLTNKQVPLVKSVRRDEPTGNYIHKASLYVVTPKLFKALKKLQLTIHTLNKATDTKNESADYFQLLSLMSEFTNDVVTILSEEEIDHYAKN